MQALGRHDMGLDQAPEGIERRGNRAHGIDHGGEGDRRALERIAVGLPVQRLVLAELSNTIIASRLGPAHPLGTTWNAPAPG